MNITERKAKIVEIIKEAELDMNLADIQGDMGSDNYAEKVYHVLLQNLEIPGFDD
jgi:hypothetical protein